MPKINAVLFDFDGTLQTGDKMDFAMRLNDTVRDLGMFIADYETMRVALSHSDFKEACGALVSLNAARTGPPIHLEEFQQYHKEHISGKYDHLIRPFPETIPTLTHLREQGYRAGLVTTRGGTSLARLLDAHGLSPYFVGAVVHRESCKERKPHPGPLHLCLELLKVEPSQAVYVGDNHHDDVGAAHNAGVISILRCAEPPRVTDDLKAPHYCIKSLRELPDLLAQITQY